MLLELDGMAKVLSLHVFVVAWKHGPLQCCFLRLQTVKGETPAGHPTAQRDKPVPYRAL